MVITMGVCIACKHYPWVRDADPSLLPVQKCHPSLPARRWTANTLRARNDCPFFEPVDNEEARALLEDAEPAASPESQEDREPEAAPGAATEDADADEDAEAETPGEPADGDEDQAEAGAGDELNTEEAPAGEGERVWNVPPQPKRQGGGKRGGGKR